MGYTEVVGNAVFPAGTGVLGVETLSAAAAVHGEYLVMRSCVVRRIGFVVTTLVAADTTAPVVEFNRRPTPGSSSGEVLLGQLTIPEGAAVGKVYYKDISPVRLQVGDALSLEHVTQAADSGAAAGAGYYMFELVDEPENIANEADAVASA